MRLDESLDRCILLCEQLKRQLDADCDVKANELGGAALIAYEEVRCSQAETARGIYSKLITIRSLLLEV